jgi:hypothetical protein
VKRYDWGVDAARARYGRVGAECSPGAANITLPRLVRAFFAVPKRSPHHRQNRPPPRRPARPRHGVMPSTAARKGGRLALGSEPAADTSAQ